MTASSGKTPIFYEPRFCRSYQQHNLGKAIAPFTTLVKGDCGSKEIDP